MTAALRFVGGDEVIEAFVLTHTDGSIVDLATVEFTMTAGVWWRGRVRIALALDDGIEISNQHPALAGADEDQVPHGIFRLSETRTLLIPFGQIAALRIAVIRSLDSVTMSSYFAPLERIT